MAAFIKHMIRFLIIIILLVLLSPLLLYAISGYAINQAKNETIQLFHENKVQFENCALSSDRINTFHGLFIGGYYYKSSEDFTDIGIKEIICIDNNCYFESDKKIMGYMPYGIVYVSNIQSVPNWRKIDVIEDPWYFYYVAD